MGGHISYARKAEIPIFPLERGPDGFLVELPGDQPTKLVPILGMAWSMTEVEAEMERERVEETRESFEDDFEEVEPHELEEFCSLIVEEFVINATDDSEESQEFHRELQKEQQEGGRAFIFCENDRTFEDVPRTIQLLGDV